MYPCAWTCARTYIYMYVRKRVDIHTVVYQDVHQVQINVTTLLTHMYVMQKI